MFEKDDIVYIVVIIRILPFAAESSLGMIYPETKYMGKSLSLYLLALAQGIPTRVHLMFLSGGNQNLCGTSAYVSVVLVLV